MTILDFEQLTSCVVNDASSTGWIEVVGTTNWCVDQMCMVNYLHQRSALGSWIFGDFLFGHGRYGVPAMFRAIPRTVGKSVKGN